MLYRQAWSEDCKVKGGDDAKKCAFDALLRPDDVIWGLTLESELASFADLLPLSMLNCSLLDCLLLLLLVAYAQLKHRCCKA